MKKLKIWPEYFERVIQGRKKAEIRKGEFKAGDIINLEEWDPQEEEYTGRDLKIIITDICTYGQPSNQAVLSFDIYFLHKGGIK